MHKSRTRGGFNQGLNLQHIRFARQHGQHGIVQGNGSRPQWKHEYRDAPAVTALGDDHPHAPNHQVGHEPGWFAKFFKRMRGSVALAGKEEPKARWEARPGEALGNGGAHASKALAEFQKFASAMDIVAGLPIPPNDGFIRGMEGEGIIAGMESAEVRLLEMNIAALELVKEGLVSRRAGGALYSDFCMKIQGARSAAKSGLHPIVERIDSHLEGRDILAVLPNVGEAELGAAIAAVEAVLAKLREAKSGLNGNKPVQAQG